MVNQSKINDPRFWAKWKASGAVGTIDDSIKSVMQSTELIDRAASVQANKGFNQVFNLGTSDRYNGNAAQVMLVWNPYQIVPADQYRKAHFAGQKVDIAVCEDPNIQFEQLGKDKSVIYHFA